ncbi:MAG: hypothetical protein D6B27_07125 [Gammaproteobacteria bacterium]|nr:MAG: hypothetical protein D6B27_07125 [Gammaproteobacteria bacterium]
MKRLILTSLVLSVSIAQAAPFKNIRIGDNDGFGFDADANFASLVGDGGSVDRNGDGHLGAGDVLPSLNGNQAVATNNGDDFDNRLNEGYGGTGFADNGTSGVEFTDIAISTSYDASSAAGKVYDANTSTYGAGGEFPASPSNQLPNQPGFVFDFFIAEGDIVAGQDIFFNLIFGDYDVTPAELDFVFAGGSQTQALTAQNNGPDDGLIQAAYAELGFYDVLTWDNDLNAWHGYVGVNFDAPNEPYTAFDYVELSVKKIEAEVPAPAVLWLLLPGFALVAARRRK